MVFRTQAWNFTSLFTELNLTEMVNLYQISDGSYMTKCSSIKKNIPHREHCISEQSFKPVSFHVSFLFGGSFSICESLLVAWHLRKSRDPSWHLFIVKAVLASFGSSPGCCRPRTCSHHWRILLALSLFQVQFIVWLDQSPGNRRLCWSTVFI